MKLTNDLLDIGEWHLGNVGDVFEIKLFLWLAFDRLPHPAPTCNSLYKYRLYFRLNILNK